MSDENSAKNHAARRRIIPTRLVSRVKAIFRIRAVRGTLYGLGALLFLIAAWTLWTFTGRFGKDIYQKSDLVIVPGKRVAVVFGAGYWPNGALSAILQDRLDAAIELYRAGRVEKLLFSGDNRVVEYNEPAKMLEYALEQSVPREAIVLDYAGRRTYDTCYRARDIFQVDDVILVTQRYHLPRALETCRALDVKAIGYTADRQLYRRRFFLLYVAREVPALWRAWWDVYIQRPVPVLGEPLPIFEDQVMRNE
ncbi:MAG TPA: ElyC/SanA/YdcF family protein [Anaerolineae bacterium]|nr:ElyC/SanA/YdcF family protein [Anaerolineae bacterium]